MQATAWAFRIIRARNRYKGAAEVGAEAICHLGDLDVTLTLGAVPEEYLDAHARIDASLDYFTGNVQTVEAAPPPPEWVEPEEVYTSIKVAMTVEVEPHPMRVMALTSGTANPAPSLSVQRFARKRVQPWMVSRVFFLDGSEVVSLTKPCIRQDCS